MSNLQTVGSISLLETGRPPRNNHTIRGLRSIKDSRQYRFIHLACPNPNPKSQSTTILAAVSCGDQSGHPLPNRVEQRSQAGHAQAFAAEGVVCPHVPRGLHARMLQRQISPSAPDVANGFVSKQHLCDSNRRYSAVKGPLAGISNASSKTWLTASQ